MDAMGDSEAVECPVAPEPISARLFSAGGAMTVTLLDLSADQAIATTQAPPPAGSIAVVARNCVRIPVIVAAADGGRFTLLLDEPLHPRRREQFVAMQPAQPRRMRVQAAAA